jgi:hypothetical protein
MASKSTKSRASGSTQNRGSNINCYPLTADEALRGVLSIGKEDAKRIIASKPGKKK